MREIVGQAKTVRQLLVDKYTIDHYQREYKWETKQIQELLEDLSGRFLEDYEEGHTRERVAKYGRYFLGSIIISKKGSDNYIVDGQQRLTSLSLLLIFLHNQLEDTGSGGNIAQLIFSVKFGKKSFNLDIAERNDAMEALFEGRSFDESGSPESVQTIVARYRDIADLFPPELTGDALPYFIDWLAENVDLVEITAYSDEDAYTIFETMNDRGLSLSPADMLKGYLIAKIDSGDCKTTANNLWKARAQEFGSKGKDVESDFFKAWLRSQYANHIRERKKGAKPEDFDRIGTEFHRWVRQHADDRGDDGLVLRDSKDYFRFITVDFDFYSRQYLRLMQAATSPVTGLESVYYLHKLGFTLGPMVMLAPLSADDAIEIVDCKVALVAKYLESLLARRIWNYRSIAYSTMQYAMFLLMREIRGMDPISLAKRLKRALDEERDVFAPAPGKPPLGLHQQNGWTLHWLLARMTDWIEQESGRPARFPEYINDVGKHRYEVEHIWANKPELHTSEFDHPNDFQLYRNRIGGLLLLPKKFNAAYGALPFETKVDHYYGQNLLAQSLCSRAYEYNPGFVSLIKRTNLPFRSYDHFTKDNLDARQELYRLIAERVWNADQLLALASE